MKKMLFIYNPMAGKEQIRNKLSDIIQILSGADFNITIYATRGKEDATNYIKTHGGRFDYVVCSGGDGTMNEVASGLMQIVNRPVCGYIPAGTVNDFASTLKIPRTMEQAAELITEGNIFRCDMGQFNNKYFTYVAGFGAFTEVSYQTPQEWKNALGKVAYFAEALKHIADIKTHYMRIDYDGHVLEDEFILGLVSNSISVAGYKAYSEKNIMMDDGLFEALFIKEIRNPIELQATLNSLLNKKFDSERIFQFSASSIHLTSDDDVQWTLDGEDGGIFRDVIMTNHQRALSILCDKETEESVSQKYLLEKEAKAKEARAIIENK